MSSVTGDPTQTLGQQGLSGVLPGPPPLTAGIVQPTNPAIGPVAGSNMSMNNGSVGGLVSVNSAPQSRPTQGNQFPSVNSNPAVSYPSSHPADNSFNTGGPEGNSAMTKSVSKWN